MCGIAGVVSLRSATASPDPNAVARMLGRLRHRGPDGSGIVNSGRVSFGATRLAIHDLAERGVMPLTDPERGASIVMNGEIYNFRSLREELDYPFRTETDTEVALACYLRFGEGFLQHLNGIFGLAIWDPSRDLLLLARDRLGVKPLFLSQSQSELSFASECRPLLDGEPGLALPDRGAIAAYLLQATYDHSDRTFFEGIRSIPPAHMVTVRAGAVSEERYWTPVDRSLQRSLEELPEADLVERLEELVLDSVERQLDADVPVGVSLSGGLDSSIMLAAIDRIRGGQKGLRAFTYAFGAKDPVLGSVKDLAGHFGWEVEPVIVEPEMIPAAFERTLAAQEQPFPGLVTVAKHMMIERAAQSGVIVLLEGQGGDEVFAGYPYVVPAFLQDVRAAMGVERAQQEAAALEATSGVTTNFDEVAADRMIASGARMSADGSEITSIVAAVDDEIRASLSAQEFFQPFDADDRLRNVQYRDLFHTKLPRILRSCDRASMAASVELRVPLLDHRIVQLGLLAPAERKIGRGHQRLVMRLLLDRWAPDLPTTWRPKDALPDPQAEWLRGPLRVWVEESVTRTEAAGHDILTPAAAETLARFMAAERVSNSVAAWQIVAISRWASTFLGARRADRS